MKKALLINFHSFVDVITNSSTELFVGESSKSLEFIKEMILDYLNLHFKYNENYYGFDGTVESICTVEIIDESNLEHWVDQIIGWTVPYWIKTDGKQPNYWDFNRDSETRLDDYNKADKEWSDKNKDVIREGLLGRIVIQGNGDNDIPYELFDAIESVLDKNSIRIHQG